MKFLAAVLVLALAGCAGSNTVIIDETVTPTATATVTATATATPTSEPLTFAVVGDSLTSWTNQSFPDPVPPYSANTWLYWSISSTESLAGGWAGPGARAADMAVNIVPVTAQVLVVQALTNDVGNTASVEAIASLEAAIATTGVPAVVVCAIPPKATRPELVPEFNAALQAMAAQHSWPFIDPWAGARTPAGDWIAGASPDGIHPSEATAQAAASVIVPAMRAAVAPR